MHLHYYIAIFTLSYYYIYNDLFTVIYWTEWYNLKIRQLIFLWITDLGEIYVKFFKIYKLFLWITDIKEIYVKLFTNYSQMSYINVRCQRKPNHKANHSHSPDVERLAKAQSHACVTILKPSLFLYYSNNLIQYSYVYMYKIAIYNMLQVLI